MGHLDVAAYRYLSVAAIVKLCGAGGLIGVFRKSFGAVMSSFA